MLSSKFLKDIMTEAYPIIQRQLEDAKVIASFRELVTANGGDWSALKALMKAHVEDSLDDSGEGKRVRKILDKADSSNAYAEMLGLANMNEKNFIAGDDEQEDEQPDTISALLSDTSLGLVRASEINKSEPQPPKAAGQTVAAQAAAPTSPMGSDAVEISTPITEPQPLTQAGSDLTNSQALNGQVATHPEAKTSTDGGATEQDKEMPADSVTGEVSRPDAGRSASATSERMDETAGETAPKYAAPGIVTWETYPPEGVTRSAVSIAFANIGQDAVVIKDDLANGHAQPIVKIGKEILDGWARFMTARDMTEMDGKPLSYSVVQYDGTDPLIDAIKWNVEGRVLDENQKRQIAATLTRQHPKRKDDIYRAFELWMEPV